MSNSIVRDAFVTSVTCRRPPVSRHSRKLSIVPKAISPASARARAARVGCRAASGSSTRRNMGRSPARCAARRFRRDPPGASARTARRSAGPARRSRYGPAGPVVAVPQHRRLTLVGDADRGDRAVGGGGRFAARRDNAPPDLLRVVLDPAGLRIMLGEFDLRGAARPARRRRTGLPGCWWCPGRSPEYKQEATVTSRLASAPAGRLGINEPSLSPATTAAEGVSEVSSASHMRAWSKLAPSRQVAHCRCPFSAIVRADE